MGGMVDRELKRKGGGMKKGLKRGGDEGVKKSLERG